METALSREMQTLTEQLKSALVERADAQIVVGRLSDEDNGDGTPEGRKNARKRARLALRLEEAEGRAEIVHRLSYTKATDSSAKAAVKSDPTVVRLREEIFDLREQEYSEDGDEGRSRRVEKLRDAEDRLLRAEASIEATMQALETYRVLVASGTDRR